MEPLRTIRAVDQSRILAVPRLGRFGRKPAVLAAGILPVWNPQKREDARVDVPADLSTLGLRDCRSRRRAVARSRAHPALRIIVGRQSHSRADSRRQEQCPPPVDLHSIPAVRLRHMSPQGTRIQNPILAASSILAGAHADACNLSLTPWPNLHRASPANRRFPDIVEAGGAIPGER